MIYTPQYFIKAMKFKRSKRVEELLDLKPVTDEELEDLLNDEPKSKKNNDKRKKKKREFDELF